MLNVVEITLDDAKVVIAGSVVSRVYTTLEIQETWVLEFNLGLI